MTDHLHGRFLFYILLAVVFLTSCIPQKRLVLLQNKDNNKKDTFNVTRYVHHICNGDNIYVTVTGIDENTAKIFNFSNSNVLGSNNNLNSNQGGVQVTGMYLQSYTVNDSGYIEFPIIKRIYLKGLTIRESQKILQDSINQYANNITAIVKYVSFQVTMLGEFVHPEQIFIYNEQINLFQAIGMVGDFTEYANKNKITIIRKYDKGNIIKYIDLTDKKSLESEYFYLHPDDVIYAPPMAAKSFGLRSFQFSTGLSLLTSVLLLFNVLKL